MRVAWARNSERQAPNPRRPGTWSSTSRSKTSAVSVPGTICMCTYLVVRYVQAQAYRGQAPQEGDGYVGEVLSTTMVGVSVPGDVVVQANAYMLDNANGANLLTIGV